MGLELDGFKNWVGHNEGSGSAADVHNNRTTPQVASGKVKSMSSGFSFNNNRYAIGADKMNPVSTIIK